MEKIDKNINMKYTIQSNFDNTQYIGKTFDNEIEICKCIISIKDNNWTISSWFTDKKYANQGIGKQTLANTLDFLVKKYGHPNIIEYIWNGSNQYVLEWISRHFDATCICPLAVQKTQMDDDWLSHIYELNVDKVLQYFDI